MLRCGASAIVLFNIKSADSTTVAMKPAVIPFVELDMAISQIGYAAVGNA